jgi:hypothetical protein
VCLGDTHGTPRELCREPLLMLQDLGATFGPTKVDYEAWTAMPLWEDEAACLVSMRSMPYNGILFPPTRISEAGRALLADRLDAAFSRSDSRAVHRRQVPRSGDGRRARRGCHALGPDVSGQRSSRSPDAVASNTRYFRSVAAGRRVGAALQRAGIDGHPRPG